MGNPNVATDILKGAGGGQSEESPPTSASPTLDEAAGGDDKVYTRTLTEIREEAALRGGRLEDGELELLSIPEQNQYLAKVRAEDMGLDERGFSDWRPGQTSSTGEEWYEPARSTITHRGSDIWNEKDVGVLGQPNQVFVPQYDNDYARRTMGNMSAGQIAALELSLWQAGYISNEPGSPQNRSTDLIRGFDYLITEADAGRNDWEDQLEADMVEYQKFLADEEAERLANETEPIRPGFVVPAYRKPDYATLAQHVKATVRDQLQRQPTESELSMLSGYLEQQYRNAWQSNEVDVGRDDWTRRGRAAETGQEQGAPTIGNVDPVARFDEQFEERYEGELAHRQRVDQSEERTTNLFGSFDMLTRNI